MATLITGGAGYFGSVTVELLRTENEQVIVLDNLSRGHRNSVDSEVPFYKGDVGDSQLVKEIAQRTKLIPAYILPRLHLLKNPLENLINTLKTM